MATELNIYKKEDVSAGTKVEGISLSPSKDPHKAIVKRRLTGWSSDLNNRFASKVIRIPKHLLYRDEDLIKVWNNKGELKTFGYYKKHNYETKSKGTREHAALIVTIPFDHPIDLGDEVYFEKVE